MAKVIIGNASAINVTRQDSDSIRRFYSDILCGKIVKEDNEKDIIHLEENFYILFRYGDVPAESEFLRSQRTLCLQIKSDNVEKLTRKILDFGDGKNPANEKVAEALKEKAMSKLAVTHHDKK
jgi:hypothetical protein